MPLFAAEELKEKKGEGREGTAPAANGASQVAVYVLYPASESMKSKDSSEIGLFNIATDSLGSLYILLLSMSKTHS